MSGPQLPKGHAAHTVDADEPESLPGEFSRPICITMLGAGSGFTVRLMNDVLLIAGTLGGEIRLVDIDRDRLTTMHKVVEKVIEAQGQTRRWKVSATPDRAQALPGTDYIVNCIEVSGTACVRFDNDIPAKYGVDQCIGDTIGPGGLFKSLRTVPVWLEILRDAARMCPSALVLNYTNPMNVMCLAAGRTSAMQIVGLCHSVQKTGHVLAQRAGVPYLEMAWECAGINHMGWYTSLRHEGRDLYPILMEKARRDLAGTPSDPEDQKDLVRKDMMLHFGAFITESSGHLSEYLPYYRKRKDILTRYCRDAYHGGSSFYADNWPAWRKDADTKRMAMLRGEESVKFNRSWEYASWIIEAREKDRPFRIHGNVMNTPRTRNASGNAGPLISNLMADGCVEVSTMVDRNGFNPTAYGKLPPQMAALCDSNMRVFDLVATACIERSKEAAIHALLLDPLTSACCSTDEIQRMTLELFDAEQEFLPGYK